MEENNKDKIVYVSLDDIIPNRFQPRLAFDEKELNKLSESIKKYGIIQPIVLRKIGEKYEIIAGERRYKASLLAGLKVIPSIINQTDDNTSAEIALLENIQRKNLTVIEEAQSYRKLMEKGFTQDDIANKLGVSQSSVANKLRLLSLPKEVQNALLYNKISERHARSLLTLSDSNLQNDLLNKIISNKLTVKQTEEEINKILNKNVEQNVTELKSDNDSKKDSNEIPDYIQNLLNVDKNFEAQSKESILEKNKNEQESQKNKKDNDDVEEFINFNINIPEKKEEIVKIPEFHENNNMAINPFQENFINKINAIKNMDTDMINKNFESKTESKEEQAKPIFDLNKIKNSTGKTPVKIIEEESEEQEVSYTHNSISLPKVIEKVRNMVSDYNTEKPNLITTTELDMNDKYRIIIEINKNE